MIIYRIYLRLHVTEGFCILTGMRWYAGLEIEITEKSLMTTAITQSRRFNISSPFRSFPIFVGQEGDEAAVVLQISGRPIFDYLPCITNVPENLL